MILNCLYSISMKDDGENHKLFWNFYYTEKNNLSFPIKYSNNSPSNLCLSVLKKMFSSDSSINYMGYMDDILFLR